MDTISGKPRDLSEINSRTDSRDILAHARANRPTSAASTMSLSSISTPMWMMSALAGDHGLHRRSGRSRGRVEFQ